MMKLNFFLILTIILFSLCCTVKSQPDFKGLNASSDWNLQMSDECINNWQNNWFLDGLLATIDHDKDGMNFSAGPVNRNDAHHAVIWTKKTFKGDIKLEYNFTRTDSQIVNVNILYIQATGIGTEGFYKDISLWNEYREVPTMSKYYYKMNALHISYAAFNMVNDDSEADYVRVRKYPAVEGKFGDTEIPPSYDKTGLFLPGVAYKITIIKTNSKLFFQVEGESIKKLFSWDLKDGQSPTEGRIGLRHMFTRSAQYSDFNVWVKQ